MPERRVISPGDYVSSAQPTEVLFEDTFTCVVWAGNTSVGTSITFEEYLRRILRRREDVAGDDDVGPPEVHEAVAVGHGVRLVEELGVTVVELAASAPPDSADPAYVSP